MGLFCYNTLMNLEEYDIMYRVEQRHWWYTGLRALIRYAWRRHIADPNLRLLDIGCGTGANLSAFGPLAQSVGIDISPRAIQFCRKRKLEDTAVASAMRLPFKAQSFDAVMSMDVLYHRGVPDKSAFLGEARRVLVPEGVLLLNVPAYQWLYSSHDASVHTDRRFTKGEINSLLDEAGFDVVQASYWNTLLFPPMAALRMWRKLRPSEKSDLEAGSGEGMGSLFRAVLALERGLMRIFPLPFGLSIFVTARVRPHSS